MRATLTNHSRLPTARRRRYGLRLLALILLLGWAMEAQALRCGSRIIDRGDSITRAARYCPEPFWVERWQGDGVSGPGWGGAPVLLDAYEAWYLNFGPRKLMRRLLFRNGELAREDTLDYGFSAGELPRDCSARELEAAATSLGRVYAECGPPDHEYRYPVVVHGGGYYNTAVTVIRYVWTYEFGRQYDRELHFENGQLVRIDTLRD